MARIIFISAMLLLSQTTVHAGIAFVQSVNARDTVDDTTVSVTINGVTAGNFLVVTVVQDQTSNLTISSVSDGTNSFTATPNTPTTSNYKAWVFYLANSPGGNRTITVTFSASSTSKMMWVSEFSGVDNSSPLHIDNKANNDGSSSTNINTPTTTTTLDGCLIVAAVRAGQTVTAASGNWTLLPVVNGNGSAYQVQAAAGSVGVTFTQSPAGGWNGVIAAFKPAASGIAFVQTNSAHETIQDDTISVTLNSVTAGNFLVAVITEDVGARTVLSVSDGTNNFTKAPNSPGARGGGSDGYIYIYYLPNSPGGNRTITVTYSAQSVSKILWVYEFSGVDNSNPLNIDAAATSAGGSTNINTPSATTTVNGALLVGGAIAVGSITSAGGSWNLNTVRNGNGAAYQIQSTAGAVSISFTQTPSAHWGGVIAAFNPDGTPALPSTAPSIINNPLSY